MPGSNRVNIKISDILEDRFLTQEEWKCIKSQMLWHKIFLKIALKMDYSRKTGGLRTWSFQGYWKKQDCWNSRDQWKRSGISRGDQRKIMWDFQSSCLVSGLGNSDRYNTSLWNFQGWSFILPGISSLFGFFLE